MRTRAPVSFAPSTLQRNSPACQTAARTRSGPPSGTPPPPQPQINAYAPSDEKAPRLHVAELPPLDVVRMHETPPHSERTNVYPHRPAVAVANSLRAFDHLNLLPRRRQPLERPRLCMPTKQLLRGCLDPGTGDEHFRPRHIFHRVLPARSARTAFPSREANRATGGRLGATGKTVAASQLQSRKFPVRMNARASALMSRRFLLYSIGKIRSPHHQIFRPRQLRAVSSPLFCAIQGGIRQPQDFLRVQRG